MVSLELKSVFENQNNNTKPVNIEKFVFQTPKKTVCHHHKYHRAVTIAVLLHKNSGIWETIREICKK